jgi:acetyltransferase-like isoleucine patch superfamily enzyme
MIKSIFLSLVGDVLRHISGSLGVYLRRAFYHRYLYECGKRVVIDTGVSLVGPEWISLGDDVWIDKNVVIIAGLAPADKRLENRSNVAPIPEAGRVKIGSKSHIGIGTVIQGHGGTTIAERFTSSPYCLIYSQSNDYKTCRHGTIRRGDEDVSYIRHPVCIDRNVWLGAHVSVFGHTIGSDTFVRPGSLVISDIEPNTVADGNPARRIRSRFIVTR